MEPTTESVRTIGRTVSMDRDIQLIKSNIREVPDFPKKGILFYDITPVLGQSELFQKTVDIFAHHYLNQQIDMVVAIESRGFIFGSPLAYKLKTGYTVVRKVGKLPYKTIRKSYELEYGTDHLEMHEDAIKPGMKVLIVDDLLATGGTALATSNLVEELGGEVVSIAFLVELTALKGREKLGDRELLTLIKY
ncbi:adenine phosphoribosyltransferase [Bdellovibrionota bacterium]